MKTDEKVKFRKPYDRQAMTDREAFRQYEVAYNEGILFAAQAIASRVIRLMNNGNIKMLPTDRVAATAWVRSTAMRFLEGRGIIPTSYDVMTGKAEEVVLDFNMNE